MQKDSALLPTPPTKSSYKLTTISSKLALNQGKSATKIARRKKLTK